MPLKKRLKTRWVTKEKPGFKNPELDLSALGIFLKRFSYNFDRKINIILVYAHGRLNAKCLKTLKK